MDNVIFSITQAFMQVHEFKEYGKSMANPKSTAKCRKKVRQKYGKPEEYGKMP